MTQSQSSNPSSSRIPNAADSEPAHTHDIERAFGSTGIVDPFQFRDGLMPDEELTSLRQCKKHKPVAKYQGKQNELIMSLLKPMEKHTEDALVEEEANRLPVKIAVYASLAANIGLCILQMYAAISSLSLSLIATGVDSVFDIGTNLLLWWLHRKAEKLDTNRWPVGGARLETIGNTIYGFLMGSANLVVIVESIRTLASKHGDELAAFHLKSIIAVAVALAVKFILFLYCYSLRNKSSQVLVLWKDHRNDLFINTFGILMSAGGSKLRWWLDPTGAVIISSGIIISWGMAIREQFGLLAGKSAPHEFLQLVIYKVATFSDEIKKVDTVRAYHSGPKYFVEVDVVMDANTPLWKAHDLSEGLQEKIEVLPNVERAFVHVDHETLHTPEHRKAPKVAV